CNLTSLANVEQVTWQKVQGPLLQNIGTYSHKYGENIIPPYVNRLHCKILEPNASFITIQKVTFEDEACYKCLFNTFPYGSHGGQTCLNVLTVSELATELHPVPGSEDLLSLHCSAVGKPAPGISIYPSQALVSMREEYFTKNPNSTVTISKINNISLKTVRSLGLQHLVVSMTHPLGYEEKIVPLPVKQEDLIEDSKRLQKGVEYKKHDIIMKMNYGHKPTTLEEAYNSTGGYAGTKWRSSDPKKLVSSCDPEQRWAVRASILKELQEYQDKAMKGDRDRDPHWSTGQKSQGPNQEQKEGEHEQGTQDREGYTHTLRQWGCSFGNSPRPAGLSLKKHGIKPDLLNIADNEDY
ncbi:OX-2 membrane glycoprotein, partial [Microtus ochrogaster]